MCGITGIVHPESSKFIDEFSSLIAHRGPDDHGVYNAAGFSMAHRRLAIQDTSPNGHQPMFTADGRYVISFNGEIYNHWELRKKLEQKYCFKSTSDTETLLYGYVEYGERVLEMLNGIFAFAIYDTFAKELFIARDHFGVKPLYYYQKDEAFLFSSEIKSMLALPGLDRSLRMESLMDYLYFLWSPGSCTPFQYVRKLEPGHWMKLKVISDRVTDSHPVTHRSLEIRKYYEIPFRGEYGERSEKAWIDELEERLFEAVRRQLLSDVPIGFFLSGGIDSSLIAALAKKAGASPLHCFTIETALSSEREGFTDDLPFARLAARHLGAELDIVKARIDIAKDFDKMVWHLDEPQADAAPLNVLNISALAREKGIVVLLGGTGGDDLFSGYRRHQSLHYEGFIGFIPAGMKEALARQAANMQVSSSLMRRLKKFLVHYNGITPEEWMANYFGWLPIEEARALFKEENRAKLKNYDPRLHLLQSLDNIPLEKNRLNQMLYWELKYFLPDHNLNYTDKMSMAHGVEVRVPYLDKDLVEFSATIPPGLKMKGKTTKYLLRKVAERHLPKEIVYRPKTGFGAPVRDWITGPLDTSLRAAFEPEISAQRNIFDPKSVFELRDKNKNSEVDASYSLWCLLAIASWWRQFAHRQMLFTTKDT